MKRHISVFTAVLFTILIFAGCAYEAPITEATLESQAPYDGSAAVNAEHQSLREAAWNDLSEDDKNTIVGDWKSGEGGAG